jgi:hypothetical protein
MRDIAQLLDLPMCGIMSRCDRCGSKVGKFERRKLEEERGIYKNKVSESNLL